MDFTNQLKALDDKPDEKAAKTTEFEALFSELEDRITSEDPSLELVDYQKMVELAKALGKAGPPMKGKQVCGDAAGSSVAEGESKPAEGS